MIRVLIGSNEPVLARGLETTLMAGGLQVAAVCSGVFQLFEQIEHCHPDIAVLDNEMVSTPEVLHDLRRLAPQCLLVLWPRKAVTGSSGQLAAVLNLLAQPSGPDEAPTLRANSACSESERRLITLVGFGLDNAEIAAALGLNRTTVQKLVADLACRFGTEDRHELALYGLSIFNETYQKGVHQDG